MTDDTFSIHSGSALSGKAYRAEGHGQLLSGEYDLLLMAPSWDDRCTHLKACDGFSVSNAILVEYAESDSGGRQAKNRSTIETFCSNHAEEMTVVRCDNSQPMETWQSLKGRIDECYHDLGRPLRIAVESSTCSRFLWLALLAYTTRRGMASRLSFLYAEARYRSLNSQPENEVLFTSGEWKAVAVPGLEGRFNPGGQRFWLVSIGFEGRQTARVVTRSDPDRISILLPDPGFEEEYAEKTLAANSRLMDNYRVPNEQVVRAPAGDAIGCWKALSDCAVERTGENAQFVCCGPKPHSLALGLRALELGYAGLIYHIPETRVALPLESSGVHWRYDIDNRFAL